MFAFKPTAIQGILSLDRYANVNDLDAEVSKSVGYIKNGRNAFLPSFRWKWKLEKWWKKESRGVCEKVAWGVQPTTLGSTDLAQENLAWL